MEDYQELFLPTLHTFKNNNVFTGSWGNLRYKITPSIVMATPKEVDTEQSAIKAEYWHGIFCYEKSEIEEEQIFPMSEKGWSDMRRWLMDHV